MAQRDPLHQQILDADARYGMFDGATSVVIGVSGGQDSVALLHALAVMDEYDLRLGVAHLHHGMRAEVADEDQEFVEDIARELGAKFFAEYRDVVRDGERDGMSVEVAGRRARYSLYARVLTDGDYDRIATGHTGSDRAETLLLNLFRGAGLDGMRSIPPRRGRIVRPLIAVTRQETEEYCVRHGLPYRTDVTNLQPDHARRNKLRLEILPLIREMFPEVEHALIRACETIEEEIEWTDPLLSDWLDEATEKMTLDGAALLTARLAEMPAGALHRVLRMALDETRGDLLEVSREQVQRVAELVTTEQTGREVELPGGWTAHREYERLTLQRAHAHSLMAEEAASLTIPGSAELDRRGIEVEAEETVAPDEMNAGDGEVVYVNAEVASDGLVLRSWYEGERLQPLGMDGSKKLSDLFTDLKVPSEQRREVGVIVRPDGEILWVIGHRLSETARVATGSPAVKLTARVRSRHRRT